MKKGPRNRPSGSQALTTLPPLPSPELDPEFNYLG